MSSTLTSPKISNKSCRRKKSRGKIKLTKFNYLPFDIYRLLGLHLSIDDIIRLCRLNKKLTNNLLKNNIFLKNIGNLHLTDDDKLLPESAKILKLLRWY